MRGPLQVRKLFPALIPTHPSPPRVFLRGGRGSEGGGGGGGCVGDSSPGDPELSEAPKAPKIFFSRN